MVVVQYGGLPAPEWEGWMGWDDMEGEGAKEGRGVYRERENWKELRAHLPG